MAGRALLSSELDWLLLQLPVDLADEGLSGFGLTIDALRAETGLPPRAQPGLAERPEGGRGGCCTDGTWKASFAFRPAARADEGRVLAGPPAVLASLYPSLARAENGLFLGAGSFS